VTTPAPLETTVPADAARSASVPAGRRAVVLVGNPAAPYSRGLRIARALAAEGYAVEIAAVAVPGLPEHEWDGDIEIRRYRASGPFARMAGRYQGTSPVAATGTAMASVEPAAVVPRPRTRAPRAPADDTTMRRAARVPRLLAGRVRRLLMAYARWALWPHTVRGWWATLARDLRPADLYHACGSLTIAPALAARDGARRAGRDPVVVYDAIDDVFESNNVVDMPGPLRRWHARRERGWARAADGRTTVNTALAERLARRWAITTSPVVVPNYPDLGPLERDAADTTPDLIRAELGLGPEIRIVVFQGRLGPGLGLDEAAEAILLVPDAALVLIGFGRWWDRSAARDGEPRFAGRHFTLPARHPDELPRWTASADASVVPLPPISFNQRHATPNKFWEAIAVGTPVVVGPDLPVMDDLVARDDLGAVAASLGPADLAAAMRSVLDRPAADRAAWRSAIRATARARYGWPAAEAAYRELVRSLVERSR
jgi:glycosyltransferase involved in cell wall biosynthesis